MTQTLEQAPSNQETKPSLNWSKEEMVGGFIVSGKIGGQDVELHWYSDKGASFFRGTVDGIKISDGEAKDMWMKTVVDELEGLFKQAKEAHTKFEEESGVKDEDWAAWYAEFIYNRLHGRSDKEELEELINKAALKYTSDNWPREYAGFIANALWE
ncbi:MAG: hypothetical protein A3J46_00660 [Candidatus Yanofskybacteria bacterium RIFCSPHIGHO2_02_FULL_41_11]|uniref:Uncharacterized protein n=1 Tax=Candidatus Yanofskybacteria bacterium RIFCSPHIGHO2_02_FULL_41_11 TaxID=1802675 RepID=A0A1F8FCK6_9BACT|nr:MAG: hypothetical protein A3J46_00660 [Candidatus Yanofskybacteria bacterium RIFCSPHIGHO2_02_FULL_41_11]